MARGRGVTGAVLRVAGGVTGVVRMAAATGRSRPGRRPGLTDPSPTSRTLPSLPASSGVRPRVRIPGVVTGSGGVEGRLVDVTASVAGSAGVRAVVAVVVSGAVDSRWLILRVTMAFPTVVRLMTAPSPAHLNIDIYQGC